MQFDVRHLRWRCRLGGPPIPSADVLPQRKAERAVHIDRERLTLSMTAMEAYDWPKLIPRIAWDDLVSELRAILSYGNSHVENVSAGKRDTRSVVRSRRPLLCYS